MGQSKVIVLWLMGGVGVILLYAAYKGKSPTAIFTASLSGSSSSAQPVPKGDPAASKTPAPTQAGDGTLRGATLDTTTAATSTSSGTSSGLVQSNGTWYVTDQYGNPTTAVPNGYATNPNTYIPPNTGY